MQIKKVSKMGGLHEKLKNRLTDFLEKFVEIYRDIAYNKLENSGNTEVLPILRGIDTIGNTTIQNTKVAKSITYPKRN